MALICLYAIDTQFQKSLLIFTAHILNKCLQGIRRVNHLLLLGVCHADLQNLADSVAVHHAGKADTGICHVAVVVAQYMGHGKYGVLILNDGLHDT